MKSDQRTRKLSLPEAPGRPSPGLLTMAKVDGLVWTHERLADGTSGWRSICPCGRLLSTGFLRVRPCALQCKCKRWARLP